MNSARTLLLYSKRYSLSHTLWYDVCDVYGSPRTGGGEEHLGLHPKKAGPRWGTPRASLQPPRAQGGDITARGVGVTVVSVGRSVGRSVGPSVRRWVVGWVSGSVGRSVSWSDGKSKLSHVWSHQSICRFEEFGPGGSVRPRSASRPTPLGPHLGLHSPRASLERSRPEVGHTSGFTAPAGCPRWGHPGEARGVPHPLPCPGYRPYPSHDADEGLVDDEWKRVPGGPFVARLIVQVAPARLRARYHRNCFNVAVPFDPIAMGQGWLAISAGRVLVSAVSSLVAGWGQGSGRL